MKQILLHASSQSIAEDIEFYLTDRWDKHNQVRPAGDIRSMTPDSTVLAPRPDDKQVGNFLYPIARHSLDRIFIGPSIRLFSNHWGASFLLQLLRMLAPAGAIVLPVHPEGRAHEKGYWCRSSLESSFQNRTGWKGISNITAENDGVMSMRVGCRWPRLSPSTIDWFFAERSNLTLSRLLVSDRQTDSGTSLCSLFAALAAECWDVSYQSAVIEKILLDRLGPKRPVALCHMEAQHAMLAAELALTPRLNISRARVYLAGGVHADASKNLTNYFQPELAGRLTVADSGPLNGAESCEAVLAVGALDRPGLHEALLGSAWARVQPGGVLVLLENWGQLELREQILRAASALPSQAAIHHYPIDAAMTVPQLPHTRAFLVVEKRK